MAADKHDVVVVGSVNMDLTAYVPRMPRLGETLHGTDFAMGFGGKGANQAVMAARYGAVTAMVACVGDDVFGARSRENFVENGVDPALISVATGVSTGVAPIFVDASGSNAIVIVPGANDSMTAETVAAAEPAIARASVLVTQNEISRAATLEALRIARRHGVLSIFNPAPAAADFEPELFRLADVVCPNESEAEILCGFPVATPADARAAALQLLQRGPKHVIITLGAAGVLVASSAEGDGDARVEVVPAPAVACVVDTSGAGDCFIGTLAAELAQGADVVRAASVAVRVASVSVTRRGTQSSYPKREELAAGGV